MRRLIVLLFLLILVLAACGGDDEGDSSQDNDAAPTSLPTPTQETVADPFNPGFGVTARTLETQTVAPGDTTLTVNITMPPDHKLNEDTAFIARVTSADESIIVDDNWSAFEQIAPPLPLQIPISLTEGNGSITANLEIYWCEAIEYSICYRSQEQLTIPLHVESSADATTARADVVLEIPES